MSGTLAIIKHKTIVVNALSARQGGGQTYVINLLLLAPREDNLDILVLSQDSLPLPSDRNDIRKFPCTWNVANPLLRTLWERLRLPALLNQVNADVLFCTGGSITCRPPARCKTVTIFRNMIPFDLEQRRRYRIGYMRIRNWLLKRVFLRSMERADLVICLSEYARGVLETQSQSISDRTTLIPHGIPSFFRRSPGSVAPKPAWLPAGEYALYASTIDHYKDQIEVIQAFAIVRRTQRSPENLVLVGPANTEYLQRVMREITRLGLDANVIVRKTVPYREMPGLYQNALVNIFASECENCPNILLEALASSRPMLVSNRPPMPEFAGDAAVYFNPRDPSDLASKLSWILANPNMMKDLAERAERRSRLYDWQSTANATWKAIENLCQAPTV